MVRFSKLLVGGLLPDDALRMKSQNYPCKHFFFFFDATLEPIPDLIRLSTFALSSHPSDC